MALPLSGIITSQMILTELGFTGSGNVLRNVIQKQNGRLQVLVNNVWVNLNMCSPYLPSEISPYIVASDWSGYNHSAVGATAININGNFTPNYGETKIYYATVSGTVVSGLITWEKFENGVWVTLGTGSSKSINWVNPVGAKVRATITNNCSGNSYQATSNIYLYCEPPTYCNFFGDSTAEVGHTFGVLVTDHDGTNTTIEAILTGPISQVSHNTSNDYFVFNCTGTGTATVKFRVYNTCGEVFSAYQSVTISQPTVVYDSQYRQDWFQKLCPTDYTGTFTQVTANVGLFKSNNSQQDANDQRDAWMQNQADASGVCNYTGAGVTTYYSPYYHQYRTKTCPNGQVSSSVLVHTDYGQFTSTVDQATVNATWQSYIDSFIANNATCTVIPPNEYPSEARTDYFEPICQSGYHSNGSVLVEAPAGLYTASSTQAANDLRDAWMQTQANSQGTCLIDNTGGDYTDMTKISVEIFVNQYGTTTVQINNFTGSYGTISFKWRPYVSNPDFELPWYVPSPNTLQEGWGQYFNFGASLAAGNIVQVYLQFINAPFGQYPVSIRELPVVLVTQ